MDGATGNDDPWDFGTNKQYPRLKYGGLDPADQLATVSSIAITSRPAAGGEYRAGETIAVRLNLSQTVVVGTERPTLAIAIGDNTRNATLDTAAGTVGKTLDFSYEAQDIDADQDTDGISIATTALTAVSFGRTSGPSVLPNTLATAQANHKVNATTVDYDANNDGLIEISTLAQLNAMRWDLDGNGAVDSGVSAANTKAYRWAFPARLPSLGCPDTDDADSDPGPCVGYELAANLDFDTNGDGVVDEDDDYWNEGAGWEPIGGLYDSTFRGNGKIIRNLFINRTGTGSVGLFLGLDSDAEVSALGIHNADVTGGGRAGILVGTNQGATIAAVYTTGAVSGVGYVGGLVGAQFSGGAINACYSTASVAARTAAVANTSGAGGLAGFNFAVIRASYATGPVSRRQRLPQQPDRGASRRTKRRDDLQRLLR